ncbi:MAG: hypothetical protein ACRD1U_00730 [Vicinamibacterales bacterium]
MATLQSHADDDSLRETVPLSGRRRYLVSVAQRTGGWQRRGTSPAAPAQAETVGR